jgi:hypothetical protein
MKRGIKRTVRIRTAATATAIFTQVFFMGTHLEEKVSRDYSE